MRLLRKSVYSSLLKEGLVYRSGNSLVNKRLKECLLAEQRNFCAYTERFVSSIDFVELEHFNSSKKDKGDDYFNYYAVTTWANRGKPDKRFEGSSFFSSLFFQSPDELNARIRFIDNTYEPVSNDDKEAEELISFLRLNSPSLMEARTKHLGRLKKTWTDLGIIDDKEKRMSYFDHFPEELNFITAIEVEFNLDLERFWSFIPCEGFPASFN